MQTFLGILLLVMSIFLVIAVLMQNGKSKRLSGSIAGGAETFFGKAKSRTIDAVLSKVTTVVAIIFVIVVIVVYVVFGSSNYLTEEELMEMIQNGQIQVVTNNNLEEGEDGAETPADETPADETPADETPADETPADETPADETPADETETPAQELVDEK